jgi:CHAD domain-containing protein
MRLDPVRWLDHLEDARARALAGDAEGVHQVRVALRHLRVWLSFKRRTRGLDREVRWLGRALAPLRDLDVFGEVLTAEARAALRDDAEATATRALRSDRAAKLVEALGALRWPRRKRAERVLARLEDELHAQRRALKPGDGDQAHRVRRALRRVRYARDWLGQDARPLAAEQDALGALCDLLALARFAQGLGTPPPPVLEEALAQAFSRVGVSRP